MREILLMECISWMDASRQKGLYEKINNYAEDIRDDGTALFLAIMNHSKKNLYEKYEKQQYCRKCITG